MRYYKNPNFFKYIHILLRAGFTHNKLKALSLRNQSMDYKNLLKLDDDGLWGLHSRLENIRVKSGAGYDGYDYGQGYNYQSFKSIFLSGYRQTEDRIVDLDLRRHLIGKSVFDIGCNAGFLLLQLSNDISSGCGIDINPSLIDTANAVKDHLDVKNIDFKCITFEEVNEESKFDVVLSCANHSTYDGNTKHTLNEYFRKCASLLNDNGKIIFESHPPQLEPEDKLQETLEVLKTFFNIETIQKTSLSGFLDKDRTIVIGQLR